VLQSQGNENLLQPTHWTTIEILFHRKKMIILFPVVSGVRWHDVPWHRSNRAWADNRAETRRFFELRLEGQHDSSQSRPTKRREIGTRNEEIGKQGRMGGPALY
jgi:hypothetical protein